MDQTQIPRYVSKLELLLYVTAFTQKDFHYVHTGPSTKGPPLRNYNSTPGVHNSSLSNTNLYARGGHLAKHKAKKNTLGDHKDHKQSLLVILKDHKLFFSQTDYVF